MYQSYSRPCWGSSVLKFHCLVCQRTCRVSCFLVGRFHSISPAFMLSVSQRWLFLLSSLACLPCLD